MEDSHERTDEAGIGSFRAHSVFSGKAGPGYGAETALVETLHPHSRETRSLTSKGVCMPGVCMASAQSARLASEHIYNQGVCKPAGQGTSLVYN